MKFIILLIILILNVYFAASSNWVQCYCWRSVDCLKATENRTIIECLGCRYHYKRGGKHVDELGCAPKPLNEDYCEKDGKGKTCYCRKPFCNDKP